jgi:hypothetical protein
MKFQTPKKLFTSIVLTMLSVSALVFYNSCQKENTITSVKTEEISKANNNLNSGIVYTDVIPDNSSTASYNLDLNNDGIIDFTITHTTGGPCVYALGRILISPVGINQVAASATSFSANNMTDKTLIDASTLTWSNSQNLAMANCGHIGFECQLLRCSGPWLNAVDGCLGLQLALNSHTYYGWARLSVSSADRFTIQDYAYNSVASQSIRAGQSR